MKAKKVEVGNFCVVLDSSFSEHGVLKGDLIYLAGDHFMQVKEDDPYTFRRLFVGAYTIEGHVDVKRKPFLIDGKRLRPVGSDKQKALTEMKEADFTPKEED